MTFYLEFLSATTKKNPQISFCDKCDKTEFYRTRMYLVPTSFGVKHPYLLIAHPTLIKPGGNLNVDFPYSVNPGMPSRPERTLLGSLLFTKQTFFLNMGQTRPLLFIFPSKAFYYNDLQT